MPLSIDLESNDDFSVVLYLLSFNNMKAWGRGRPPPPLALLPTENARMQILIKRELGRRWGKEREMREIEHLFPD